MHHEETLYPVCPHRNVPAAFQRFLGPDSGGIERFFPGERRQRADGMLLIVRLQRAARETRDAVTAFNDVLSRLWMETATTMCTFAWNSGGDALALLGRLASLLFGSRPERMPA